VVLPVVSRSVPGSLRQEVVVDGRHRILTDEPFEVGGEGSGPSPHELLPAALASCVATTLVIYAKTRSWDLGEVTVAVNYDQRSSPRRCEIRIGLTGNLSEEQVKRLEAVAGACPVRRAMESGFEFAEEIRIEPAPMATPSLAA